MQSNSWTAVRQGVNGIAACGRQTGRCAPDIAGGGFATDRIAVASPLLLTPHPRARSARVQRRYFSGDSTAFSMS